jgi:hypothetical protein
MKQKKWSVFFFLSSIIFTFTYMLYLVWATPLSSSSCLPFSLPLLGRSCAALFSNFVEEKKEIIRKT